MPVPTQQALLAGLFEAAVKAADPLETLWPGPPEGAVVSLAADAPFWPIFTASP